MSLRHGQEDADKVRIFISISWNKELGAKLLQPLDRDVGVVIWSGRHAKDALSYRCKLVLSNVTQHRQVCSAVNRRT